MAKGNSSSNVTSSSVDSDKAAAPLPSDDPESLQVSLQKKDSKSQSKDSKSPQEASQPAPSPSSSSSPSPSPSPSPQPSPPPPSPSLPPPPPKAPPPSPPPPAPQPSPPAPVPPPQPVTPIPTPTPPPSTSTPTPPPSTSTPPSPVTPPPAPPTGSVPGRPPAPPQSPPVSSAPPSRSGGTPSGSQSPSRDSGGDKTGEYVGFGLAGFFIIAFIGLGLFLVLRRRKKKNRGINEYSMPPPPKGGDVHCYLDKPCGVASAPQDGFYHGTQLSHSGPGPYGNNVDQPGSMRHMRTFSDPGLNQMSGGPVAFSYEKVVEITNGFSSQNVIGEGGFGCVYKASMPDGRVGAVKMLKAGSGQGEREFRAEVEIISRVHHRHLVSLIGYCISEQQRVLIYEFVPNGNLSHHLHGGDMPVLDWPKRMKIANGAARGLAYLHEGCNPKIIHRDIKSANILLDNAYEAQVADFGLARLTDDANTHVSTRVMGTFGYMAPEYATSGKLTDRSDVYSFGVVLLELITGRKPVDPTQPIGDESLVEWARPLLLHAIETHELGNLVDPRLEGHYVESEMFRMIEAAAACCRHSAPKRPRMVQVARVLDRGEDQTFDLSNGVKYGQSFVCNSGQYNEDLMRFRRMVNGSFSDSDFDLYSKGYSSREIPSSYMPSSSGGNNPQSTAFDSHSSSVEQIS